MSVRQENNHDNNVDAHEQSAACLPGMQEKADALRLQNIKSRLTLDWDNMSYAKMLRKARLLNIMYPDKQISIRKSSSGRGWHAVVYGVQFSSFDELLEMRYLLGDDEKRIEKDAARYGKGVCCSVLFSEKGKGKKAQKWL